MKKYLIKGDLDTQTLGKITADFQTSQLPKLLKMKHYYEGKQKILQKHYSDASKPCNKVVTNFCKSIVDNYNGFITGQPISYTSDTFEDLQSILNYNDVVTEDSNFLKNALMYGVAYEICFVDKYGNQCFKVLDSKECIPVYSDTLTSELKYVIRIYQEDFEEEYTPTYTVEVWSDVECIVYKSEAGFSSFRYVESIPHYYKQVPVIVFDITESVFESIISLQDSYNNILSSQVDDFEAFVDSYMIIKGMTLDEDEDFTAMKENRVLIMDADADASYLTKNSNEAPVQNILKNIEDKIWNISACPNMADKDFMAQSGVAIKFKLVGFQNVAANIKASFKQALQKRIELLAEISSLVYQEADWRDVQIIITDNLPDTLTPSSIQEVIQLKGLVSNETLLMLLPFVKDPEEEMQKVQEEQNAQMALYDFGHEEVIADEESYELDNQ